MPINVCIPGEDIYLVYPEGECCSVIITSNDLELLNPGEFLNDSIVDFYLMYIARKLKKDKINLFNRMHFFNSFFYKRYVTSKSNERYKHVRKWTKEIDIFSKDFLIIPINERFHWSLIIICYPG